MSRTATGFALALLTAAIVHLANPQAQVQSTCNIAVNGSFETPNIQDNPPQPATAYVGGWAV